MLPVNVDGMIWLTTNYTTYNTPIIIGVLAYVFLVLIQNYTIESEQDNLTTIVLKEN